MNTPAKRRSRGSRGEAAPPAKVKPENPRRYLWLTLGLLAAGIVLFMLTYSHQSVPLAGIDAEDYATIGRQLAQRQGFTTLFMPLNGLAWLKDHGMVQPPWPNISRFPLPPLVMALIFRMFGPSDVAAAGFSLLGYLAAVPFVVLLGRWLGGFSLAALAGALYVIHPDALQIAISALTEPASAAILLAGAWLVLRRGARSHLIAGAVFGLGYWNRTTLLLMALPAAVAVWKTAAQPRRSVISLLGAAALTALPWIVHMWLLTGNPLFNLQNATVVPFGTGAAVGDFPWYDLSYQPVPASFGELMQKWVGQVVTLVDFSPSALAIGSLGLLPDTLGPLYLLAFAIIGWFVCPPAGRPLRWLVLAWLLLQIAVYSFAGNITRFYTIFLPFVELFGVVGVLWLAGRTFGAQRARYAAGAVVLLVALPSLGAVTGLRPFEGSPARGDPLSAIVDVSLENGPYLASKVPPGGLVLSNLPWSVAWRAERPAVPLPHTPDDLSAFEQATGLKVSAIYLTPQMYIVGVPPGWRDWNVLRDQQKTVPGFRFDRRFLDGSVLLLREGA